MKTSGKLIIITVMVLAILLALATPAMAEPRSFVCDGAIECQIFVLQGTPTTYPAGEPFFISHAVNITTDKAPVMAGFMGFALEVDGTYIEPSFTFTGGVGAGFDPPPNLIYSGSAFNFPQGLSPGEHTFIGHWYAPACVPKLDGCEGPIYSEDFNTAELTVIFEGP